MIMVLGANLWHGLWDEWEPLTGAQERCNWDEPVGFVFAVGTERAGNACGQATLCSHFLEMTGQWIVTILH